MIGGRSRGEPRILCVAGPSGSGKTTLIRALVRRLPLPRPRIGIVKHTHHRLEWHPEGKDSRALWEERPGALAVAGPDQTAVFVPADREDDDGADGGPAAATRKLVRACGRLPGGLDLVLAEGFTDAEAPTLWVDGRGEPDPDLAVPGLRGLAVPAGDVAAWEEAGPGVPVFSRDDVGELAARASEWAVPRGQIPLR